MIILYCEKSRGGNLEKCFERSPHMLEFFMLVIGIFVGIVVARFVFFPKNVGTLLFHDPHSMFAEINCPVEDIYNKSSVMFIVSRR
jgi:hypothetical protein